MLTFCKTHEDGLLCMYGVFMKVCHMLLPNSMAHHMQVGTIRAKSLLLLPSSRISVWRNLDKGRHWIKYDYTGNPAQPD